MWINVSTIGDLVDRQAELRESVALVMSGVSSTYPELSTQSDEFAASLVGLGVRPGDKVGILMHNCLDFVLALLAAAKIGAVAVPINGRFKAHDASYVISHADVTVLLTAADPRGTDYPELVRRIFAAESGEGAALDFTAAPTISHVVSLTNDIEGFLTRKDFERAGADVTRADVKTLQSRVRVRDIALLMYTSGTTARPKGCLLTHEALTRHGEKVARTRFMLTPSDGFWDPLPLFHCGGLVPMLGCFSVGAKYCHPGHFDAGEALKTIHDERCTVLYPSFEAIWLPVIEHPDFEKTDLSHVRLIQNIATPERMAQFEARMPWARQVTSYGSTECATNLTMGRAEDPFEIRVRTLGQPVEGMEVKIVDPETGVEVPTGTMGEMCFRGYSSFEGYYKEPEQTAAMFDADGYFHSGDRACMDEDGNMIYGGRLKDMLKVGGENVAAIEIEDFLTRHPAVRIAQVVGVPDDRYGEVAAAFVELVTGQRASAEDLISFCTGTIASYKVPRHVRFVTEWPMSGTKVRKVDLKAELTAELSRSVTAKA
ncbi:class I adenylate-forming enzyme family protein [soil metagenome]